MRLAASESWDAMEFLIRSTYSPLKSPHVGECFCIPATMPVPAPGPWSQITRSPCELSRTWPLQRPGQWDYQGSNRDTRVCKAKKMYFKDFLSYLCKGLNWKMFTKKKKGRKTLQTKTMCLKRIFMYCEKNQPKLGSN